MQLARVCGQVISTKKAEKLMGFKILVCQPIDMVTFEEKGAPFVSIDSVGAGDGELVMCVSGSSSRQTALTDARPVDNCIVAIIDSVDILGERCFDKADPSVKPAALKQEKQEKSDKPEKAAKAPAKKPAEQPKQKAAEKPEQTELKMTQTKPKKQASKKAAPKPKAGEEDEAKRIVEEIIKKLDDEESAKKAAPKKQTKANKPKEDK